jgi:hypothetical protein
MDRQKLEASATLAALVLLAMMLVEGLIGVADGIFGWDLLSKASERIAMFLMTSTFLLLLACVLVSVMLNLSIIAQKLAEAVDRDKAK